MCGLKCHVEFKNFEMISGDHINYLKTLLIIKIQSDLKDIKIF